jgi:hypothetical protein
VVSRPGTWSGREGKKHCYGHPRLQRRSDAHKASLASKPEVGGARPNSNGQNQVVDAERIYTNGMGAYAAKRSAVLL